PAAGGQHPDPEPRALRHTRSLIGVEETHLRALTRVEAHFVLPREAGVAEMLRIRARGLQHALQGEIAEAVGAQVALDLVHPVARPDQLLAGRRVDAIVATPLDSPRGAGDRDIASLRRAHPRTDL